MKWSIVILLASIVGCGNSDDGDENGGLNNPAKNATTTVSQVKDDVKNEVVDRLDCSGLIREETRNQITAAIESADFDAAALVAAPEELARFVGAVAASTDASALLVGNVAQIARIGHMPVAHGGMWDTLECDAVETVDCVDAITRETAGAVTSTVVCDATTPSEVRLDFTGGCTLFVTENAGAVSLRRQDDAYAFEDFSLGSVRQVNGVLKVQLDAGATERITVGESGGISIGSNAGKSCEELMTISTLIAERDTGGLSLDIDAERLSDGKTFSVRTPTSPATFSAGAPCTCPDPGSVMDWRWTGFLKGLGDANLRLTYSEATVDGSCSDVGVEILSWPEQCDGETADCGKAAVEKLLGPLVTATCVRR